MSDLQLPWGSSPRFVNVFNIGIDRYIANTWAKASTVSHEKDTSLATVISIQSDEIVDAESLERRIRDYRAADDVFHMKFLQGVVFTTEARDEKESLIPPDARALLRSWGNQWLEVQVLDREEGKLAPKQESMLLHEYSCSKSTNSMMITKGAFLTPLLPGQKGQHNRLNVAGEEMSTNIVAVPSRLRSHHFAMNPLEGLRIAVKDNFHIKGVRTSLCNRAYNELYPPPSETASCIAQLESAGAHILGTTKLAAFAATEEPLECVDYQAPWNPRGDGYQSPAGSSSGSGVAIASYDWLDIAIGSDTSGIGRRPGHWNGCFALRPTHVVVSTEGFVPSFPQFDTPTFLARSISKCRDFAAAWYGEKLEQQIHLPLKVIVATDYLSLITNLD